MRYALGDDEVTLDDSAYVASSAALIGRVQLAARASVWFGAVLRGDEDTIFIGEGSNVQDNCVLHTDRGFPMTVGDGVTIGHLAILHGCIIGAGSLIGMGSTLMNGVRIGRNCLIGARTLLTEGKEIPDNAVVRGSPGKIVGEVTEAQIAMMQAGALSYRERAAQYRIKLREQR
jgi:carbonic anhydrase/acetyltransferase-like protein (isoleucine patch superfamily)